MRTAQFFAAASPIARREMVHALKRAAVFELARATEVAASLEAVPAQALWLNKISERLTACAASSRVKRLTPPGEPTALIFSHLRACRKEVICMICARKRSARLVRQYGEDVNAILDVEPAAIFVMAVFTVPNVPVSMLAGQLDLLQLAYRKLLRLKRVDVALLGSVASIEISFAYPDAREPEAHAHVHATWVLKPTYLDKAHSLYIDQRELTLLWSRCANAPKGQRYIVHIHRIRDRDGSTDSHAVKSALAEIFKYQTKSSSLVRYGENGLYADATVVAAVLKATHRRRAISSTGIFLAARKRWRTAHQPP
jgi:hypothetical protein